MLALNYRFTVQNSTGVTLPINVARVTARRWKFSSNGSISYEPSETEVCNISSTIVNKGIGSGSAITNSGDLYIGGDFIFRVTAPISSNGDVHLFYETSTDGSQYPSSGLGIPVTSLTFAASGTKWSQFTL
jgi:hypothetical protein